MGIKLSIEDLIEKVREDCVQKSANYLYKRVEGKPIDSSEIKELNAIKKELKFLEKEYGTLTGKKSGGTDNWQELVEEFMRKAKEISPTVGSIVRTMPNKVA